MSVRFGAAISLGLISILVPAQSQSTFFGPNRFPQFRGISGLSGGGFGVLADGRASFRGAMAISTPIGHTLGHQQYAIGFGVFNMEDGFPDFNLSEKDKAVAANATATFSAGFQLGSGNLNAGWMILSGVIDGAGTLQYSPHRSGPTQFSFGVQDWTGGGGSSGEFLPNDSVSSRSFYFAATHELRDGVFLSGGIGTRRFEQGFASLSAPVGPMFKGIVEHDGFGFNFALGFNAGPLKRHYSLESDRITTNDLTFMVGALQGRYIHWSVQLTF